ncbi:hypothetical protein C8R46DRAFT_1033139 [Mycena filopes]|nr:hypothetical protein C8R46DRAFT_1033139 [Mycena filopes]
MTSFPQVNSPNACRALILWRPNPWDDLFGRDGSFILPQALARGEPFKHYSFEYYQEFDWRRESSARSPHILHISYDIGCRWNARAHHPSCWTEAAPPCPWTLPQFRTDGEGVERAWAELQMPTYSREMGPGLRSGSYFRAKLRGWIHGRILPSSLCLPAAPVTLRVPILWKFGAQRNSSSLKKQLFPTRPQVQQRTVAAARHNWTSAMVVFSAATRAVKSCEWTGVFWETIFLVELGLTYQLGHGGRRCPHPADLSDFMHIFDTAGVQKVRYRYCNCLNAVAEAQQLLDAGWHRAAPQSDCCLDLGVTRAAGENGTGLVRD